MTYAEAKPFFYRFEKNLHSASDVNGWPFKSRWRKEDFQAVKWYMAQLGCISNHGHYDQWWEYDTSNNELRKAQINLDEHPSIKSIIRRPGCLYAPAYNESWALKEFHKQMSQHSFTFRGRVTQVFPMKTGKKSDGSEWKRLEFIVEEEGRFPNLVLFNAVGKKADAIQIRIGDDVSVDFQMSSQKRGERYYTDAMALNVTKH